MGQLVGKQINNTRLRFICFPLRCHWRGGQVSLIHFNTHHHQRLPLHAMRSLSLCRTYTLGLVQFPGPGHRPYANVYQRKAEGKQRARPAAWGRKLVYGSWRFRFRRSQAAQHCLCSVNLCGQFIKVSTVLGHSLAKRRQPVERTSTRSRALAGDAGHAAWCVCVCVDLLVYQAE